MLASSAATSDLTGKFCSPTTVQWALDTWALGNAMARAMTERGGKTWYFVSFDYALGKALQRDTTEAVEKLGGKVLGAVTHPLGTADFSSYLLQAQASGADVIALGDTGADAINAIKQAGEFRILGKNTHLAALFMLIVDIDTLGLKAAAGLLLSEPFYWDLNDSTRAWSKRFAERRGEGRMPTLNNAATYSATIAYLRAVRAAQTVQGDKVVGQMKATEINDPLFGRVKVRQDGRAIHDMYVFEVKSPEESKGRYDYYKLVRTIPPEEAFRPMAEGGCPLVH
jgi:branched-chain amino acid transport system substrate-binding protein